MEWAKSIVPNCVLVVQLILDGAVIEQHAYRACFGVLSLAKKHSKKELEKACKYLIDCKASPSLRLIKSTIKNSEKLVNAQAKSTNKKGFRRGAEYFEKRGTIKCLEKRL